MTELRTLFLDMLNKSAGTVADLQGLSADSQQAIKVRGWVVVVVMMMMLLVMMV
jgi:cytochrome b involved in lipid metabolism